MFTCPAHVIGPSFGGFRMGSTLQATSAPMWIAHDSIQKQGTVGGLQIKSAQASDHLQSGIFLQFGVPRCKYILRLKAYLLGRCVSRILSQRSLTGGSYRKRQVWPLALFTAGRTVPTWSVSNHNDTLVDEREGAWTLLPSRSPKASACPGRGNKGPQRHSIIF